MKKIVWIFAAVLAAAPMMGAERSVGLKVAYGPDSYLVDYPSGYQQTINADVYYTEVYKKGFFRFGWSAGLGYSHLWGDNAETKTDIDEMLTRNDAYKTYEDILLSTFGTSGMSPSYLFGSYQWVYSDFHGFSADAAALAGVEFGKFGADLLVGAGFDYVFMKAKLGELGKTDVYSQLDEAYKRRINKSLDEVLDVSPLADKLSSTYHMMQISVPLEIRPFVKVADHVKIVGAVKTDVYAKNYLFGDQTYSKDLFFKNWEFGVGAEFVF